jgi:dipeptidyl-peptidase-4
MQQKLSRKQTTIKNMKKIKWLFVMLFVFASLAEAQEKMLSIDDIYDPQKRVRFSGNLTPLQWNKDGSLRQVKIGAGGAEVYRFNALTGEAVPFYDKSKLEAALVPLGIKAEDAKTIANQPTFTYNRADNAIVFDSNGDLYFYDFASGSGKRLTNNAEEELEADFSPDGKMVSFVRGMNLFVVDVASGKEKQLTRDGGERILNGYLDWVYEEELYGRGNKRGYWWSPDSRFIAFLRTDETPVPKFVLPDDTVTDQRVEYTDYPQAGDPNPLVTLGIADVNKTSFVPNVTKIPKVGDKLPAGIARFGDSVKFVDLSKYTPENFLISRVAWSPDAKTVVFQAQNREQTFLDLNAANTNDGKFTTLFTERTKAWVEAIDNPVYLADGSFIWQSERDGFRHLYHIAKDGKMIRQITKGRWEIGDFYGVDEKNNFAYFSAIGEKDWIGAYVYRIKLDGSGLQNLTPTDGTHRASFNPDFTQFTDVWSDVNTPQQMRLYAADGKLIKILDENKVPALSEYKLGKTEFLKVKTRDNFEMEAMRILPPDFDASKKYPVFAYTYSGPHAPSVKNSWGGSRYMWHQMLAQKGYIIWICDNRTASGKGADATWNVYKKFGQTEVPDLEDGFSYLKSQPYVDASRLGMWGWSYGGFMTSYFMTHSNTLKMGIAGGLVGDWALYDSIYTERYMLTPKNNPDGYLKNSVIGAAKNLNGKLLIIHGMMDNNVHMQNSVKFMYELQKLGKQFEFMPYPTQRHGVVNPYQVKHMQQMMTDFVLRNL